MIVGTWLRFFFFFLAGTGVLQPASPFPFGWWMVWEGGGMLIKLGRFGKPSQSKGRRPRVAEMYVYLCTESLSCSRSLRSFTSLHRCLWGPGWIKERFYCLTLGGLTLPCCSRWYRALQDTPLQGNMPENEERRGRLNPLPYTPLLNLWHCY